MQLIKSKRKINSRKMESDFDEIVFSLTNGCFTDPNQGNVPHIKLKEMNDYCEAKGIEPYELTIEEREQFIIR